MKDWKPDKAWADRYWPEIERILRLCAGDIIAVTVATPEEDKYRATDYEIELTGGRVGCRIRRGQYLAKWCDFTLRSSRPSGHKTEVEKIGEGWGDWYLYGWAGNGHLMDWKLVNLDMFRRTLLTSPHEKKRNRDGSSAFYCWPFDVLREQGCIVREANG